MSATSFYSNQYIIRLAKVQDRAELIKFLSSEKILQNLYNSLIILLFEIVIFLPIIFIFMILPLWKYSAVLEYDLQFIISGIICISIALFPIVWFIVIAIDLNKRLKPNNCAVALYDNKIVGIAALCRSYRKTNLVYLFVQQEHRQKGVGTNLLKEIVKTSSSPIYVESIPPLSSFYLGLGFEKLQYKSYLRTWLNKNNITEQLILFPNSQISRQQKSGEISSNDKYTIQKASDRDLKNISRLLASMYEDTKDSFLPYGFNIPIKISLPYCILLTIEITLLCAYLLITMIDFSEVTEEILFLMISLIFIMGIISIPKIVLATIKKHSSQLWLIIEKDKVIGYARMSRKEKYSIVHHVYCLSSYDLKAIGRLIKYLEKLETQPIHIACTKKMAETYYKYGFMKIKTRELPQELKLGGKVSLKFGGVNLVLLP